MPRRAFAVYHGWQHSIKPKSARKDNLVDLRNHEMRVGGAGVVVVPDLGRWRVSLVAVSIYWGMLI